MLLSLEARIPHESLTAAALIDWKSDPSFLSDAGLSHWDLARWAAIADECRTAILVDGRGATVTAPLQKDVEARGCCAVVRLASRMICRVYDPGHSKPWPDGAIAILTPPVGSEVLEIRYRSDEVVAVQNADGSRVIKQPQDALRFRETVFGQVQRAERGLESGSASHGRRVPVLAHNKLATEAAAEMPRSARGLPSKSMPLRGTGSAGAGKLRSSLLAATGALAAAPCTGAEKRALPPSGAHARTVDAPSPQCGTRAPKSACGRGTPRQWPEWSTAVGGDTGSG